MIEPNKENIRAWVEALRSGSYKQGKGYLRTAENEYCCLGVACEVGPVEWGAETEEQDYGLTSKQAYSVDGQYNVLPYRVQDWLGVPVHAPFVTIFNPVTGEQQRVALWLANDYYGLPFNVIADLIEKEYLS